MKKLLMTLFLALFALSWQMNAQYLSEDFEGGAMPAGWSEDIGAATQGWTFNTDASSPYWSIPAHTTYAAVNDDDCNCDMSSMYLITSAIDLTSATSPELSFEYFGAHSEVHMVKVSTDNGATWTDLATLPDVASWTPNTISLAAYAGTSNLKIAFFYDDGGVWGYGFAIDDVVVAEPPACAAPTNLSADNITQTQADLSWTPGGSETVWNIELGAAGFTPTGTPTNTGVSNPFTVTGLTAGTSYDYYVQADCGGGSTSAWAGPYTFTTLCNVISTFPYTEDFASSNWPACWTQTSDLSSQNWIVSGSNNSGGTANEMGETYQSGTGITRLISPEFDLSGLTTPHLEFKYFFNDYAAGITGKIQTSTDGGATWTDEAWSITSGGGDLGPDTVALNLSNYGPSTLIAWVMDGDHYQFDWWTIDDVFVGEAPSCAAPSGLSASNITTTQADLSWTENGSATVWNVEFGIAGFAPTGVPTDSGVGNPFTKGGLTSNTSYDFYVQADCGGTTSAWTGPYTFTTPPGCDDTFYDDGGLNGDYSANLNQTMTIYPDNPGDVVTVTFNSFDMEQGWDGMMVYDGTDTTAPFFDSGSTYNRPACPNGAWTGATGDPYTADGQSFTATNTSGALTLVFTSDGSVQHAGWEAVVTCAPPPACPDPSALSASNITTDQADLSWTPGGSESAWNIEFGPAGFAPTGTPTDTGVTNPFTKTGLTASTSYDYYVQADCGGGDTSSWVGPYTFTTPPVNDDCSNAILLPVETSCNFQTFDNSGATDSGVATPACSLYNGGDVWFSFVAPETGNVLIDSNTGDITDGAMAVYSGSCGSLTEIACDDDSSVNGFMPMLQLANLNPGETYYIRFWEYGGNTFGTFDICVSVDCSAPVTPYYAQDFSTYLPSCWSESNDSPGAPTNNDDSGWVEAGWLHYGTTGAAAFNVFAGNDRDWLISPHFDLSGGSYVLSVDVGISHWKYNKFEKMSDDDNVYLKYSDDGGLTWNDLMNWNKTNQPDNYGRTEIIPLAGIMGSDVQFAFYVDEGGDDRHSYIFYVDNFIIKEDICAAPTNLTVTSASAGNADLSWTDNNGGGTTYTVEWREYLSSTWNSAPVPAGDTTYTITGLNPSTEYEWRLQYTCDSSSGLYESGPNFFMDCATLVPDYLQDFSTYLPDCWRESNDSPDKPLNFNDAGWKESGFAHNGTTGAAVFNFYAAGDMDWLISPKFDLSSGSYVLTVDVAVTHWQHPGPPTATGTDDKVILRYTTDNGSTWTDLYEWNQSNFPSATGDNVLVDISSITAPEVMFAFYADEGTDERISYNFYVDNFNITTVRSAIDNSETSLIKGKKYVDADVHEVEKGLFNVRSTDNTNISSIYVYDLTGRLLYRSDHVNSHFYQIPLHATNNSVYIFHIGLENDSQKVIKKVLMK